MGRANEQRVQLRRDSPGTSWGFRLSGGRENGAPLSVQRVFNGSPSDGQLQRGDVITSVGGQDVSGATLGQAHDLMATNSLALELSIQRSGSDYDSYGGASAPAQSSNYSQQEANSYGNQPWSQSNAQAPQQSWKPQEQNYGSPGQSYGSSGQNYGSQSYGSPSQNYGSQSQGYGSQGQSYGSQDQHYGSQGQSSGSQDHHYGSQNFGGHNSTHDIYKSTAQFSPQGQSNHYDGGYQDRSSEGGQWGGAGGDVVWQDRGDQQEGDEGYEQKSVSNIKGMFDKPDEAGVQRVSPMIKRGPPRAPMYRPNEDLPFSTPEYGPTAHTKSSLTPSRPGAVQRGAPDTGSHSYVPMSYQDPAHGAQSGSSLTPSRPGAVQRGAPDNRPHSYVPMDFQDPSHGAKPSNRPTLYGYSEPSKPSTPYTGGFVGVNALTKPIMPVKTPPKKKGEKKDFDPNQSSVLRVLQEEETRSKNNPRGYQEEEEDDRVVQGRVPRPRQHPGPGSRANTGKQWEQRQQREQGRQTSAQSRGGPSLQALLEKDQAANPQEDPSLTGVTNPPPVPVGQSEYRRPGTNYKPAKNQPATSVNLDEEYPLPDKYATYSSGYKTQKPSYQSQQPSHQSPRPSYQTQQPSYQVQQQSYQSPQPSYQNQQPSYGGESSHPSYQSYQSGGFPSQSSSGFSDGKLTSEGYYSRVPTAKFGGGGGGYKATGGLGSSYGMGGGGLPTSDF